MDKRILYGWVCAVIVFAMSTAKGEMGPAVGTEKKLLAWGVNAVDSTYLKGHITELEKEYAMDGIVITFAADDFKGSKFQQWALFGGKKYTRDDFKKTIAELKETKFNRFTDNFLYLSISVRGTTLKEESNIDWFDERWSVIAENMALYASIAKEAGFKGIMLDAEFYPGGPGPWTRPFYYEGRPDKDKQSLNECATQVHKRGKEMMSSITKVYPEITIIIIPGTTRLVGGGYELVSPFVDGMLEGKGDKVTIIDGGEGGYPLRSYKEFSELRQRTEKAGFKDSRVPELYKKNIRHAFGFWVDHSPVPSGSDFQISPWFTDAKDINKNFRTPEGLEYALYNALSVSDSYVWLYVWHPDYWWNSDSRLKENLHRQPQSQCALCPHAVMPQAYLDAFKNCRKPHDTAWIPPVFQTGEKIFTPEDLAKMGENILTNGDFEKWSKGLSNPADTWSSGIREDKEIKDGSYSTRLTSEDIGHIFIDQHIPSGGYAGKTIIFGTWVKTTSGMVASLSIMDWVGNEHENSHSREYTGDGTWQFLIAKKTIRSNATGEIWFRLNAFSQEVGASTYFDGAIAVVEEN